MSDESFLPRRCLRGIYAGLASLSGGCPPDMGRLHTCYSPVRHSPAGGASSSPAAVRLACVKPVASVHPEPGSNSPLLKYIAISFFALFCRSVAALYNIRMIDGNFVSLSLFLLVPQSVSTEGCCFCPVAVCHCSFANPAAHPLLRAWLVSRLRLQSYNIFQRCASFCSIFLKIFFPYIFILLIFNSINKC